LSYSDTIVAIMNAEDHYVEKNERDASPERFPSREKEKNIEKVERHEPIARMETASSSASSSTTSSDASHAERDAGQMSRIQTQRDTEGELAERHPTALSRIQTQKSQHSTTVGSGLRSRTRDSKKPLPAFGAGKSYPPPLPEREEYVVEFDGHDDPLHAMNWPLRKKLATAGMLGFTTLTAAFGSSIFSAATGAIQQHFGVGSVVATLGTSFYVLGFATGPILWAPLSELAKTFNQC
jgi:DHA1 family multidrug resistance protein-like MFS transporter